MHINADSFTIKRIHMYKAVTFGRSTCYLFCVRKWSVSLCDFS